MPWDYPFWRSFRFAARAAAGNGAILKHVNNVLQCAVAIGNVVHKASAPESLFRTVLIHAKEVGGLVAAQAGKALKKQVLKLGGRTRLSCSRMPT